MTRGTFERKTFSAICQTCKQEFLTKSKRAKYCLICRKKEWYLNNRVKNKIFSKNWRINHPRQHKEFRKRWYEKNKKKISVSSKEWRQKNSRKLIAKKYNLSEEKYEEIVKICCVCGFSDVVDLHHDRSEEEIKMVGLCPNHHQMIHRKGYTLEQLKQKYGVE